MPQQDTKTLRVVRHIGDLKVLRDGGEKPCSDIQIIRTGDFEHPFYGDFSITEKDFDDIIRNFDEGSRDVPIDYNHQSLGWDPEAAKAAGWVTKVFKKDGGLWATVEWNDDAVEYIENDEYRYISPEFEQNARHKETGEKLGTCLYAAALTNRPFLEGMAPVALAEGLDIPEFYRPAKPKPETRRLAMHEQRIREILGLSEGTEITEEHRNQAFQKLDEQVTGLTGAASEVAEAAGVEDIASVTAALKETPGEGQVVQLGERVILTAEQHKGLAEKAEKADELERDADGTIRLSEAEAKTLRADAAAGRDASKKLFEKEVDDAIAKGMREGRYGANLKNSLRSIGLRDIEDGDSEELREKNLKQLKETIEAHATGSIPLKVVEGAEGEEGEDTGAGNVAEFIKAREPELVKEGKAKHEAYSLALAEARQKFGREAAESYTYAKRTG